jgi:lipopolysaccharide export system protein LptC
VTELADLRPRPARRQLSASGPRRGAPEAGENQPLRAIWRSRRVAYLKLMLPAIALLIVTLILAWPQIGRDDTRVRFGGKISNEEAETLRMSNARYVGTDDQQRPYVVTSALATRESAHAPATDLQTPKADMTTAGGAWLALTAETGVYHNDAKLLDLAGDVSLFHDGGTEFHTDRARADLSDSSAAGDDPVDGQGPSMTIKSEGFRLFDRGARIVFTGKAHLVLYRAEAGK